MVGVPGLEPGTSSLSGTRSNQLSYTPLFSIRNEIPKNSLICVLQPTSTGTKKYTLKLYFVFNKIQKPICNPIEIGGAEGTRTLDIQLAKLAL